MPGVLIDDQMDNLSPSFFEALGSFSPASISHAQQQHQDHHHQQQHHAVHQADHHQQQQQAHHQLMRHHSFSGGTKDASSGAGGGSLSHAAPVYHRSQSALSSAAAFHALNYFNSPPTTPRKSADAAGGFSPLSSLLDVGADDFSSMRAGDGDGSLVGGGLSVSPGANAAVAMAISGSPVSGDLRSLAFSNSAIVGSPTLPDSVAALHKFLPSNNEDEEAWGGSVVDVYACDQFRMFEFKVRRCMRGRSHDWTECPFAHPGEKARRRDPRRFHYSGTACPDFRKGSCRRGDACEFAHGVFECWLHPARYRTQPCKDGRNCRRRVCFFAHTAEQLRLLPAAAAANASPRGSAGSLGGGGGSQGSALSGAGSLSGSYDGSPVRSCSSASSFDGAYAFDGVSHCAVNSHGSCQNAMNYGAGGAATAASAVCGGHFEQAYGGNVGAHCCASPQMSSPTSTLVGHSTSPPPLSPPTSPGGSPPMSPQSPQHWPSSQGLHRNGGAFSSAQASLVQSPGPYGQNLSQTGFSQSPCSPLSRPSNGQSAMSAAVAAAAAHAQQHGQPLTPAHRRHLDRLNSMPALAIPPADHPSHRGMMQSVSSPLSTPSSCSPPSPDGLNSTTNVMMSDLIATIEQLGIRGSAIPLWLQGQAQVQAAAAANVYSSGPSPLRRCSQSVPCTPTKQSWEEKSPPAWETVAESDEVEPAVQRVESGRDLRAKIYGRLGKENRQDSGDAPDLGWVSELVKDEQAW